MNLDSHRTGNNSVYSEQLAGAGIPAERTILLGFSQGACPFVGVCGALLVAMVACQYRALS